MMAVGDGLNASDCVLNAGSWRYQRLLQLQHRSAARRVWWGVERL
jgi:hypothetical protein